MDSQSMKSQITDDDDLERTVARSIPVDAADALASSLAGIAGYLPRRAAAMSTATAILGTVNGIMLRSKIRQERASRAWSVPAGG